MILIQDDSWLIMLMGYYLKDKDTGHSFIWTYKQDTLSSPSSSGPRLARTSVHNNRLYLWFQFSHCRALLTVLTATSGVWDIGNCGSRSLSQISPVSSLAKFTRLLAKPVYLSHVSSECCFSCCCCCCISVSARSHHSSHRTPCSQYPHLKPLGWAECSAGSPRSQRRSPGPGHGDDNITATWGLELITKLRFAKFLSDFWKCLPLCLNIC